MHQCYSKPAELCFSNRVTGVFCMASTGVQIGDLCCSLVQFLNSTPLDKACLLSLWYLDDGIFIGSRSSFHTLFPCFTKFGPQHINLAV